MKILHAWIVFYLWCLGNNLNAAQNKQIIWSEFICVTNTDIVVVEKCSIDQATHTQLTWELIYKKEVAEPHIAVKMLVFRPQKNKYGKVMDVNINICNYFKGEPTQKMLEFMLNSFLKNSNFKKQCPYRKGFQYFRNVTVLEKMPKVLPDGDFKVFINMHTEKNISFLNATVSGQLKAVRSWHKN